jgi:phosphotransferase system HPr (HPr) family protein
MASSVDLSRDVRIVNELGLHARSAVKIARIAANAKSCVWLIRGAERADASSVLDMLALGCGKGSVVTLAADDHLDHEVLEALVRLFENGFGESE